MTMLTLSANASNRVLSAEFEVNAPIEKAWDAWTTPDGIKTFYAPDCKVDLRVDGAYEIYFLPDAKPGERGGERCGRERPAEVGRGRGEAAAAGRMPPPAKHGKHRDFL
jgi:hypothetical protein